MKLKLRHKSFITSLNKIVLKLKEKVVLYTKHHSSTTQNYTLIITKPTQRTNVNYTGFSKFIDTLLSPFSKNIQKKRNVTAKWVYYLGIIRRIIENKTAVFNIEALLKFNIKRHLIYCKKPLAVC